RKRKVSSVKNQAARNGGALEFHSCLLYPLQRASVRMPVAVFPAGADQRDFCSRGSEKAKAGRALAPVVTYLEKLRLGQLPLCLQPTLRGKSRVSREPDGFSSQKVSVAKGRTFVFVAIGRQPAAEPRRRASFQYTHLNGSALRRFQ